MMSQSLSTHEVELRRQNQNGGGGGAHASPLEIDALAGYVQCDLPRLNNESKAILSIAAIRPDWARAHACV